MPDKVKKGFTVTILTTIFSSLVISIFLWFGNAGLQAHDSVGAISDLKEELVITNQSMGEFVRYSMDNRIMLERHSVKLEHCEEEIAKCEERHK